MLLAGGDGQDSSLELYSPHDGGTSMGSLSQPEVLPSGALLPNGEAILGCGRAPNGSLSASIGAETWPQGALLATACSGGQVVAGTSGAVVVSPTGLAQAVDDAGALVPFGRPVTPRSDFGAVSDGQGGVLIVGGLDDAGLATALLEDVGSDPPGLQAAGQLDTPRADVSVVAFDGGYLVVGGIDETGRALATAQIVSGSTLLSGGELSLSQPRHFAAAAQIPGYRLILIVSGQGTNGDPSGGLDLFAAP